MLRNHVAWQGRVPADCAAKAAGSLRQERTHSVQDLTSLDNFPIRLRRSAELSQSPSLLQSSLLHLRIAEGVGFDPQLLYSKRPH